MLSARLSYAIAPPNQSTPVERRREIAASQSALIRSLPIDAVLVYDVRDEATRSQAPRPFPFKPKVDSLAYALDDLQIGPVPRVVYRAVSDLAEVELTRFVDRVAARGGQAVLVGAASATTAASMTLSRAYALCRARRPELALGGVVIAERHRARGGEDLRVWRKMTEGCRFFVSQTVWSVRDTRRLLFDLATRAAREGCPLPALSLTVSPCGSPQTLAFLEWLGVLVPPLIERELTSAKDMLARSVDLATEAFAEVRDYARSLGMSVGANVESLTARPAEVEASIELLRRVAALVPRERSRQPLRPAVLPPVIRD